MPEVEETHIQNILFTCTVHI